MKLETIFELYQLISRGTENIPSRRQAIKLRKAGIESSLLDNGFTKLAFDTRRINQETEYNPRRGLQHYSRSEAFISDALEQKLLNFAKLRKVLDDLRVEYGKESGWQDSNARILLSTLNNGLRIGQQDGDYSTSQPAQGSLDYIEELLQVRYRLGIDSLNSLGSADLKRVILSKDEELTRKGVGESLMITKNDVASQTYDTLMEKLFGNVRASADNPEIERTVTITIKDRFVK
jgi:hypothetical protein